MFRSKLYLRAAAGQSCIRCGVNDGTIVGAHYSGRYAHKLGRGMGIKAADLVADCCLKCHLSFDRYENGNDDTRAADFLLCIVLTVLRRIEQGVVVVADAEIESPEHPF